MFTTTTQTYQPSIYAKLLINDTVPLLIYASQLQKEYSLSDDQMQQVLKIYLKRRMSAFSGYYTPTNPTI